MRRVLPILPLRKEAYKPATESTCAQGVLFLFGQLFPFHCWIFLPALITRFTVGRYPVPGPCVPTNLNIPENRAPTNSPA